MLLAFLLLALLDAPAAGAWSWPVGGAVLQPFVLGDDPYAGGQHRGIDVAAAPGESVSAPAGGAVSFAGTVPAGGHTVTIRTPDGYAVTLLHLGSIAVAAGEDVTEGEPVGAAGTTGAPVYDAPYVYLGVRKASDPNGYLDPLLFLPPRALAGGSGTPRAGARSRPRSGSRRPAPCRRDARSGPVARGRSAHGRPAGRRRACRHAAARRTRRGRTAA
jgi:hypothetical protein